MSFYQITYSDAKGNTYDDYVYEGKSLADAKYMAAHKIDGSYGETSLKSVVSVCRISRDKAQQLVDCNAVAWVNTLD